MFIFRGFSRLINDAKYAKAVRSKFKKECPKRNGTKGKCKTCHFYNRRQNCCELIDIIISELNVLDK